ncbi:RNA-binding protein Cip1 [Schizosaccharomyces cryophilus OY26]|uniref:RNA-binding protein Cip1 n=1 Tax=Schizosaccharomyces cryophilus (strain OY26 / ATCC MYA-4695 / CBS 11777 / NBRC 106824 / NRRL Y48691) TaxID=653667 RepID=S9W2H8_SCHCR|nr:RNA-binding protein Cip1 [Schizosaccharomyces cryophilus OY26]EPY52624.1 RNA-binding protein Cip1 [Schizosaccharomyces cryophilus OY26]
MSNESFSWKVRTNDSHPLTASPAPKKPNHEALSRLQSPLNSPKLQPIGSPQALRRVTSANGTNTSMYPKWSGGLSLSSSRAASPAPSTSDPFGNLAFGNVLGGSDVPNKGNFPSLASESNPSVSTPSLISRNAAFMGDPFAQAVQSATTNTNPPNQEPLSSDASRSEDVEAFSVRNNPSFSSQRTPMTSSTRTPTPTSVEPGEDTIPTAIVVKNIPFSLEKDALLEAFKQLGIPRPYAFNYHYDNGIFRGLAFANFYLPEEAQIVVQTLNGYEINSRRLRVEWKRQLPAAEREKAEKAKKRQAEERRRKHQYKTFEVSFKDQGLDLNNTTTLEIYSRLLLFANHCLPGNELVFEAPSKDHSISNAVRAFALHFDLDYYVQPNMEIIKLTVTHPAKKPSNVSHSQPSSPGFRRALHAPMASRFLQEHALNGIRSAPITPPPSFASLVNPIRSVDDKIYGNDSPLRQTNPSLFCDITRKVLSRLLYSLSTFDAWTYAFDNFTILVWLESFFY